MVNGIQLDLGGNRLLPVEWQYELVSVASPGYGCFQVPDGLAQEERFAQIVVVINDQELSSIKFNWKSTLNLHLTLNLPNRYPPAFESRSSL